MARIGTSTEGVRIGPISLLTLISVLLLAVLVMLCVTTTNATHTMATRQADALAQTYDVDSCGQAVIAGIDETLTGESGDAESAASVVGAHMSSIAAKAKAQVECEDVDITSSVNGALVTFTIADPDGKVLDAGVRINDDLNYSVTQWKMSTSQQPAEETLWQSSTSGK